MNFVKESPPADEDLGLLEVTVVVVFGVGAARLMGGLANFVNLS